MKNYIRPDSSCYYVVVYDGITEKVGHRITHQCYSDDPKLVSINIWNLVKMRVEEWQESQQAKKGCDMYEFYEKMLERKDIDVVSIATPDQYEISSPHMQNFIDAVRSRKDPVAPVEVGCSTNTLCCIANIANELQRPVKWNPATLSFGEDKDATNHRLNQYTYRNPYSL
jgi:hypothetical protein